MKLTCTLLALCISFCLYGQSAKIDSLANLKPILVPKVVKNYDNFNKIYITSQFAEDEIKDTIGMGLIKGSKIVKVELVYTQYRQSETFKQRELNKIRITNLYDILPEAFSHDVKWLLLEQTKATDSTEAIQYFHGFIVTIVPDMEIPFAGSESDYLDSVFSKMETEIPATCFNEFKALVNEKKLPSAPSFGEKRNDLRNTLTENTLFPPIKRWEKINGSINAKVYVSEYGSVDSFKLENSRLNEKFNSAVYLALEGLTDFNQSKFISGQVTYYYPIRFHFYAKGRRHEKVTVTVLKPKIITTCKDIPTAYTDITLNNLQITDTTILSVLNRKTEWKEMVIVTDFTGSMAPYSAQLMLWYQLMLNNNDDRIKYFCFFNDGNKKPDFTKIAGATGGVYLGAASSFDDIKNLAQTTIKNGNGGDIPENNIEAVIAAIKAYPKAQDVIMIADNYATPRDLALLNKVTKPVKIILCGTNFGVNVDYLNFAKANGGSIYTIDQDIENLATMAEGERLVIDGITYQIIDGRFQRVYIN